MTDLSRLELAPLHRPGGARTERWSWDFVIDGASLSALIGGDVAGALGWRAPEQEAAVADRLLRRAPADLPPDRVALYVCPECGDLDCGAVTAAVAREGDVLVWRDFAWERLSDVPDGERLSLRPFRFSRATYGRALRAAIATRPGPGTPPITAV